MKKAVLIAGVVASFAASLPALADNVGVHVANAGISIGVELGGPPPLTYERLPAPRPGFVWTQGYWAWDGYRYLWMPGRWVVERPGFGYAPGFWIQSGPRGFYEPEHWERHRGWRHHDGHHHSEAGFGERGERHRGR